MASWPRSSATCSAARPSLWRSSVLAPACSNSCTLSWSPSHAAVVRAVKPLASCRSMLALHSRSRRTMAC
eukprot:scaffold1158_cov66-Phaeocystis_antarctica.AAC.2